MKFYYHPASTTCRIVMMFAEEEKIELEHKFVDIMAGEHLQAAFKKINPNCLVPALDDDGFVLTESAAIIRYLANKTKSAAYPQEAKARGRVDERMDWFYSNFNKDLCYGMVYPQLFPHHQRPGDAAQEATIAWGKDKAQHWLSILDKNIIGPQQKFLCGDKITIADYAGVEFVTLGELIKCQYGKYPNVSRWIGNMKALKSWPKVHEAFDGFAASLKDKQFVAVE
ncbi:MAG: glutathione S-transferase family protein [Woeseia sp.]